MRLQSLGYICYPACNGGFQLTIGKEIEAEVLQGVLECHQCKRYFDITDGLPNLNFRNQEYHNQHAQRYDRETRLGMATLGIWEFALMENGARRMVVDRLELKNNASVLETGTDSGRK